MPLTVSVTDGRGRPVRARGLAAWLTRIAPARATGAVTIALVSDAQMRQLNRTYRAKNYLTDVLSFTADPVDQPPSAALAGRPAGRYARSLRYLGDVAIAQGVARRQAREHGHSALAELKILSLHGLLHLLGYDHERDAGEMRRMEQRLRRKGGLRQGLIERA